MYIIYDFIIANVLFNKIIIVDFNKNIPTLVYYTNFNNKHL